MDFTHALLIPGLYNSGPQHWQTYWEKEYGIKRVLQKDWETPVCTDWVSTLDAEIIQHPLEKVVLIGHSLACCTIAHWAQQYNRKIKGALLVGPSDVDAATYPPGTTGFMPMPLQGLPFPSTVIASSNDEYVRLERAIFFAARWGSHFVDAGPLGHINSGSNLGNWPMGFECLQSLMR